MKTNASNGFLLVGLLLLLFPTNSLAAAPAQVWAQPYNGPGNDEDRAQAIAVAQNGTAYVCGYSVGANGYIDYATIAYSSAGIPLWTNRFDGTAHLYDSAQGIAVDSNNGHVYVTGYSYRSPGLDEYVTIAYSSLGAPLWTNRYYETETPYAGAYGIALGPTGTVYVAGWVGGMGAHCATVAYSGSGIPLWTNRTGPGFFFEAMAADSLGNVYIAGWAYDSHYVTIAYSQSGTPLWTNRYTGPAGADNTVGSPWALAVEEGAPGGSFSVKPKNITRDPQTTNHSPQVYVTGYSEGFAPGYDYATVAYSTDGTPIWTNRYTGPGNSWDSAKAIAVDTKSGDVFVTGSGGEGCVTIAYARSGVTLWTNHFDGSGSSIVTDSQGTVIVAGDAWTGSSIDFLTVAYSSGGIPLWTNKYNGPGNGYDVAFCLALGPADSVYVAGETSYSTTNADFATIKYLPIPSIMLSGITILHDATCFLTITAPSNTAYRLEASTNLLEWEILNNFPALPVTMQQYTDALAPTFPTRYYRAAWSP